MLTRWAVERAGDEVAVWQFWGYRYAAGPGEHCMHALQVALLDAGCGEGMYLRRTADALAAAGRSSQAYGIDVSKLAVRLAAKRAGHHSFAVASTYALPFPEQVPPVSAPCSKHFARCLRCATARALLVPCAGLCCGDLRLCALSCEGDLRSAAAWRLHRDSLAWEGAPAGAEGEDLRVAAPLFGEGRDSGGRDAAAWPRHGGVGQGEGRHAAAGQRR